MRSAIPIVLLFFIPFQLIGQDTIKLPDHPRIIFSSKAENLLRQKIIEDSVIGSLHDKILEITDGLLDGEPVERVVTGRRLLSVSRTVLKRVSYLSYAFRMTGEEKYLRKAEAEMLNAAQFSDWNPSHFLDVAEMTTALALGYDWLFHALPTSSKNEIRAAIIEKGLIPSTKDGNDFWKDRAFNWNQVCNSGMALGALATYENVPELAEMILKRAKSGIKYPLVTYEPDGAYKEGPMYWVYGTTYHVLLVDAWNQLFQDKIEVSDAFLRSGEFMVHSYGPTGFFNYGDSRSDNRLAVALFWFANKTNDQSILWNQRPFLEMSPRELDHDPHISQQYSNRFLPFMILWMSRFERMKLQPPELKSWAGLGKAPVAFHRSSWDNDAIFVGIKAGTPQSGHAHMDEGSFVMDADGIRWALDLGMHDYHKLESQGINLFGGDRWKVHRYTNFLHNTLVVDDSLQIPDAYANVIENVTDQDSPYSIINLTPVYRHSLDSAVRRIGLIKDNYVCIQDKIINSDKSSEVRWAMLTYDNINIINDTTALINYQGKQLTFKIDSDQPITIKTFSADPPNSYEDKNPGKTMLGFTIKLAPNQKANWKVFLIPGEVKSKFHPKWGIMD